MSVTAITLLIFACLVILLISGLPIAFCMGGVAALFTLLLWSPASLGMIFSVAYGVTDNFVLIAIPLFVFMGMILQHSGVAEEAYDIMYKWIGQVRGGLAIGTVAVCTIFAACVGISAAACVTMGVIALPAMFKHNYDKSIAIGSIAAGAGLGILIPPSVLMIVYGVFASESIGKLFAAGVFPGLLLAALYMIYIGVRCYLQPQLGPAMPKEDTPSWNERMRSLKGGIFPILLITLVIGTILAGVCTPTESAAMGTLGSLLCAALKKRLTWDMIKEACYSTQRLSCMVVWLIIGGSCFASLYTAVGALDFIKEVVSALPLAPYMILAGMQLTYIILGMLMDPGGIIMITVPIFVPIIKMLGFDPIWFGILFIINMEMGYLTPPFGFNLFYLKTIVPPNITMMDLYKIIIPYVFIQLLCLIIIMIFPQIAIWLPNQLFQVR
jgi:tripartite ATP-independent transporter DctM subunit